MEKWGRILSQADTFDPDYLEKNPSSSSAKSSGKQGELILVAGSLALAAVMAAAVTGS
jgi:hypothetical protein